MSTDENIVIGIISDNIKYFKNRFEAQKYDPLFKKYLNEYINGEFVELDCVYDNILGSLDYKLIKLFDNCLEYDNRFVCISKLFRYIIDYKTTYQHKLELFNILVEHYSKIFISLDFYDLLNFIVNNQYINKSKSLSFNIVLNLLKEKEIRTEVIEYFKYKINQIKRAKNIISILDLDDEYIKQKNDETLFKINLTSLMIGLWNNGITNEKILSIKNGELRFISIFYFEIQKLLDYGLINIYEEKNIRLKELKKVKQLIDNTQAPLLNDTLIKIECRLKLIKSIISNKVIIETVDNFYKKTVYWINNNIKEKHLDFSNAIECDIYNDMLENMYIFFKNNKLEIDDNLNELYINIFNNNITKNSNTLINYLGIYNYYLLKIVKYNDKVMAIPNFVHYDKNIKEITLTLLNTSNALKKSFNNDEIYNMLYPMSLFTNIFNLTIYNLEDYRFYFSKINKTKHIKYFKELLYDNLNNLQYVIDDILLGMKKINDYENSGNHGSPETIELIEDEKLNINNLNMYLEIFSKFVIKSCKYFTEIMLCDEIKYCLNNIIVSIINKLTTKEQKKYKVNDKTNLDFEPINVLIILKSILIELIFKRHNENIVIDVISENDNYIQHSILRLINILNKKDKIKSLEYSYLSYLDNKIDVKLKDKIIYEIPDELCDPIMDTLIEQPVMLPNNIIIDYGTISRHLLNNDSNPFNRELLTLEILAEYNKKDSIKTKIDEFKEKIKAFKKLRS